jgi:hypothetical protein
MHHHVAHSSESHLPAWDGSGAATCSVALDPPPSTEGLLCCLMSHSFRPHLPAREGSNAVTCPVAPDPPPYLDELRCCHVSHGSQRAMSYGNK